MKKTLSFTDAELGALWRLLKSASDEFSNHGCNDFDLPMTDESVALVNAIIKRNGDPLEEPVEFNAHKPRLSFQDDRLMSYFGRRFQEAAEAPAAPSARVEKAPGARLTDDGDPDMEHDLGLCVAKLLDFMDRSKRTDAIWTSPEGTMIAVTKSEAKGEAIAQVIEHATPAAGQK